MSVVRLVFLSDTHLRPLEVDVPDGDVLIHAGDGTMDGSPDEIARFGSWLATFPHREKIAVAGNHDFLFEQDRRRAAALLPAEIHYLQDSACSVLGLEIWGSPWQPWFHDWAFNLQRGRPIREKWQLIPPGIDVLVTHGPPANLLDRTVDGRRVGCADLANRVAELGPLVHAFGHIHEAYGACRQGGTLFVNASICDRGYRACQPPIVVDVDTERREARLVDGP